MSDQDRKTQILQAEEVIRQLAAEMARASVLGTHTEEVHNSLREALDAISRATQALESSAASIPDISAQSEAAINHTLEGATSALAAASTQLNTLYQNVTRTSSRLDAALPALEAAPGDLSTSLSALLTEAAGRTNTKLASLQAAADQNTERFNSLQPQITQLTQLVRFILPVTSAAVLVSLVFIVLLLLR